VQGRGQNYTGMRSSLSIQKSEKKSRQRKNVSNQNEATGVFSQDPDQGGPEGEREMPVRLHNADHHRRKRRREKEGRGEGHKGRRKRKGNLENS